MDYEIQVVKELGFPDVCAKLLDFTSYNLDILHQKICSQLF